MTQSPANRLRAARIARGFRTQKAFADAHGIPQPTYHLHESGKRELLKEPAERYAKALNVPVEWLLLDRGEAPGLTPAPASKQLKEPVAITIKTLRKRASLTAEEVAKAVNVPIQDYLAIERQGKSARLPKVVADALDKLFTSRGIEGHHSVLLAGIEQGGGQAEGARALRPQATGLAETVMIGTVSV